MLHVIYIYYACKFVLDKVHQVRNLYFRTHNLCIHFHEILTQLNRVGAYTIYIDFVYSNLSNSNSNKFILVLLLFVVADAAAAMLLNFRILVSLYVCRMCVCVYRNFWRLICEKCVATLNIDAIAFAVVRCGGRCLIESYIWLVVFGAWIFLSPTRITLAVLSPNETFAE